MHALYRYGVEIDAIEASNIDPPRIGGGAGPPERKNPTGFAEVISRDMRVESIEREIVKRGEEPERICLNPVNEGSTPSAN